MSPTEARALLDATAARARVLRTGLDGGALVWRLWDSAGPDAPMVVLLHGGFGAWNHWVRNIPALEAEYRVLAGDLPGCGDSDDPPLPYDAASLAALVAEGLDRALPDDLPFHLVSFSFGGVLSGQIAHAQARRIASLTIVGTPILGLTRTGRANDLVAVPAGATGDAAAAIYRGNLEKLMVHDPEAVDDLAMTLHMENMGKTRLRSRSIARRHVVAPDLEGVACPLGFVFGDDDATVDSDLTATRAHVAERHPDAAFHVVPDTGHWVQFEAADAFNAILLDLLASRR
jgi:2-hydroxy-6-oxonona-2,4-dienedioate hydrolase